MFQAIRQRLTPLSPIATTLACLLVLSLAACAPEADPEARSAPAAEAQPEKQKSGDSEPGRRASPQPMPEMAMPDFPESGSDADRQLTMAGNSLLGTEWWVEDIEGAGVIDNSHTTIAFPAFGRVAGDGGCNRYMGTVEFDGDRISFGPLAGTLMACPEALMNQDRRFHQALEKVVRWEVRDTGLLYLLDAKGTELVRAWEVEAETEGDDS